MNNIPQEYSHKMLDKILEETTPNNMWKLLHSWQSESFLRMQDYFNIQEVTSVIYHVIDKEPKLHTISVAAEKKNWTESNTHQW